MTTRAGVGEIAEVVVERPSFGGKAIARLPDGRVAFISGGAPGDRATVEITASKKRFAEARVSALLEPGADRVAPFCAAVGRCGGCPWQVIALGAQREALQAHVARLLTRVEPTVEMAPLWAEGPDRGWRATTRVHWRDREVGFYGPGSRALVPVARCPVMTPEVSALFEAVRAHMASALVGVGSIRLTADPGAASGTVALQPGPSAPSVEALAATLERFVARSVVCHGGVILGRRGRVLRQVGHPSNAFGAMGVAHPAGGFVQAHRAGNQAMVAHVVEAALEICPGGGRVLELFSGSGNFTLALAEAGCHVRAVEHDAGAVACLARVAASKGLEARVEVTDGDADRPVPRGAPVDVLVLDPPRAGARGVMGSMADSGARRVVYVSCDPATLARDLELAIEGGWRLSRARAFELFPHTGHVETVVVLDRGSP